MTYNWDGKLRTGSAGANSLSVKYDPMGDRVYKESTSGQTTTKRRYIVAAIDRLPVILLELTTNAENDPNYDSLTNSYIYADSQILSQRQHSDGDPNIFDAYFYLHDRLGSVRQLVDDDGSVANTYTYDPYGNVFATESTETTENDFKFTGQYYDSEIGQYYLRARQYDPQLYRFTARDPVKGEYKQPLTLHRYLYCGNDPLNSKDPSGKTAWNLISPILTGYMFYNQAINLAAYAVDSGNLRFFDLADLTLKFMPVAIAIASGSSYTPIWAQGSGLLLSLKSDVTSAGMGATGLLADGWTTFLYSMLITNKAGQLGICREDFADFLEWKGGFFAEIYWWLDTNSRL